MSQQWTLLAGLPHRGSRSPPVNLNGNILICPRRLIDPYDDDNRTIYMYNPTENRWKRWWSEEKKFHFPYLAIDKQNNKIFIHSDDILISYSYDDKLFLSKPTKCTVARKTRPAAYPIMIGDTYTIVGGYRSNKHQLWFAKEKKFKYLTIDDEMSPAGCVCHVVKAHNNLLVIDAKSKTIYRCNIRNNGISKYTKFQDVLPECFVHFGCVVTRCNNYVIIFAGTKPSLGPYVPIAESSGNIYILNTNIDNIKIKQSNIKCPMVGTSSARICSAINITDESKDNLLVQGFLKNIWKRSEFSNLLTLPKYLDKIIEKFHSIEIVHVIDRNGNHWNINMDEILS
eukprot:113749_1